MHAGTGVAAVKNNFHKPKIRSEGHGRAISYKKKKLHVGRGLCLGLGDDRGLWRGRGLRPAITERASVSKQRTNALWNSTDSHCNGQGCLVTFKNYPMVDGLHI